MEWISVKERLPEKPIPVLAIEQRQKPISPSYYILQFYKGKWSYCGSPVDFRGNISHWQPLPAPPTGAQQAIAGPDDGPKPCPQCGTKMEGNICYCCKKEFK